MLVVYELPRLRLAVDQVCSGAGGACRADAVSSNPGWVPVPLWGCAAAVLDWCWQPSSGWSLQKHPRPPETPGPSRQQLSSGTLSSFCAGEE